MIVSSRLLFLLSSLSLCTSTVTAWSGMPFVKKEDLPVSNQEDKWKSLNPKVSFLPADDVDAKLIERFLEEEDYDQEEFTADTDDPVYSVQPFASGMEEYDEYQQAWRLLGFMIDCNVVFDDDYYGNNNNNNGNSGSYDYSGDGCYRFVLWAAYVDLEYEGGGIGEYQYWDRWNQEWDDSSCYYDANYNNGNNNNNNNAGDDAFGGRKKGRCAKMDCHLEDTHFSLLGFFKHISYDDWMEQLFKHEGMCVWTDDEYEFMGNAREAWPQYCTNSYTTLDDGTYIYYDLKPTAGGGITVGLYTDDKCVEEFSASNYATPNTDDEYGNNNNNYNSYSAITPESILGNIFGGGSGDNNNNNGGDSLEDSLEQWNSAFSIFHTCQPCVAYNLENADGLYYNYNNGNNRNLGNNGNNYYYNYQTDPFDCDDDAGYTNVNQCMKFMAKTDMNTATFRDLSLARYQGTLVQSPLAGFATRKSNYRLQGFSIFWTYVWFLLSFWICCYGAVYFYRVKEETNYTPTFGWNVKQPLVMT